MNWTLPLRAWLAPAPGGSPRRARTALTGFAALLIGVTGLVGALGSAGAARPGPTAQPEAHGASASGSGTRAFGLRDGAASVPAMDAKLAPASPPSHSSLSSAPGGDRPSTDDGQPARVEESGAITIVVRGAEIQP